MGAALCTKTTAVNTPKPKPSFGEGYQSVNRPHELLWQAIEQNNIKDAAKYLDFNEFQAPDLYCHGQTMIHKAASIGAVEILMLLIERTGANVDLVNESLATPLQVACRNNRANIVRFLIGCGVEVNQQDEHGQTALLICCIHGNLEMLRIIVDAQVTGQLQDSLEVDLPDHHGLTPLNCAAIKGDYEMVKCLVSQGHANVNQTSPKGCTPLIYAGRGGYYAVVQYLLNRKAEPFTQDNAGGTVLHHALEKGHISVLETMKANGVDVCSALQICDNAGRTPLFEAVENLTGEDDSKQIQIIETLISKTGFGANPNVVNTNGQTPLFIAARLGSMEAVALLVSAGALVNLHNGEQVKESFIDDKIDQAFIEAYNNCMTPVQVAIVLGYDDVALYLAQECQADVNLRTTIKGYTSLHLSVLSNKPEMVMDLLRKTNADPMLEDAEGRTLLDMICQFMPIYADTFQAILVRLGPKQLATEERQLQGLQGEDINNVYQQSDAMVQHKKVSMNDVEDVGGKIDARVEQVYGTKVAMCLVSLNWELRQQALQTIFAKTQEGSLPQQLKAAMAAVASTSQDKVIKVFLESLNLFSVLSQSPEIDAIQLVALLRSEQVVQKLLVHSETSNTRVASKIHEALLDLSYLPSIGEDFVVKLVYEQIRRSQSNKGLMAQLALLFKLVSSFTVHGQSHELDDPPALNKEAIMDLILPALGRSKEDIRRVASDVLIEVQKQTGAILESDLAGLQDKVKVMVWDKLQETLLNPSVIKLNPAFIQQEPKQLSALVTHLQSKQSPSFLQACYTTLYDSFATNNIQTQLTSLQVYQLYIAQVSDYDHLKPLVQQLILKTADTNTRIRKESFKCVMQTWQNDQNVFDLIIDPAIGDKAVIGRLGLLIKKGDFNDKVVQFAQLYCGQKGSKVRQLAKRLLVDLCKGDENKTLKPGVVAAVHGLRPTVRESLISQINSVCPGYFDTPGLPSLALKEKDVLPHCEPLSQEQIKQFGVQIEMFGVGLVSCLLSQTWSTRYQALVKLGGQIQNLDPKKRTLNSEIGNYSPDMTFKPLMGLFQELLKDPVLKNYIFLLDLVKSALPTYFRYLRPELVRAEVLLFGKSVLQKTSDLKQKVRAASTTFCLYLSHQIEVGADLVASMVLSELSQYQWDKPHAIISCLDLLSQLSQQSNTLEPSQIPQYTTYINKALKHPNQQVRSSGESLLNLLHESFGDTVLQSCQKVTQQRVDLNKDIDSKTVLLLIDKHLLSMIQSPDFKQRMQGIIQIKKTLQSKLSNELLEPLTILLRHLLKDQNSDVFIEAVSLFKFVVINLKHLSQLDLHLLMGQLITIVVAQQLGVKARIQADKCIVYLCKHIGPLVICKEILRGVKLGRDPSRFYGLLHMLVHQFSIVLLYNHDFYGAMLDTMAETLLKSDDQVCKTIAQQMVCGCDLIDAVVLENQLQKMDIQKKGVLKRVLIEAQNTQSSSTFRGTQASFATSNSSLPSSGYNMSRRRANQGIENETPEQSQTSTNWLERKESLLPALVQKTGFVVGKAAGFNKSEFNSTGEYTRVKTIDSVIGYVPTLRTGKRQLI